MTIYLKGLALCTQNMIFFTAKKAAPGQTIRQRKKKKSPLLAVPIMPEWKSKKTKRKKRK